MSSSKGTQLTRSQISDDQDPFKMMEKQKKEEEEKSAKDLLLKDGDNVVRMSGFNEGILRTNLQNQEKQVVFDEQTDGIITTKPQAPKSSNEPEFDPNDQTDNVVCGDGNAESDTSLTKSDQIEEVKISPDTEFEVIENELDKQLRLHKMKRKQEVRAIPELYVDDINEDEIFTKDVVLLDMINTAYLDGRLCLTRYKLVFTPLRREKVEAVNKDNPKQKMYADRLTVMKLPYHRERYFKIPIHMIYSIKEVSDKKDPHSHYIDIATKDCRGMRFKVYTYGECQEIADSIRQQAMPGFHMSSIFVYKYGYKTQNYAVEDAKILDEDSPEDQTNSNLALSKTDILQKYTQMPKIEKDGWKIYQFAKEFKRQGVEDDSLHFKKKALWSSTDKVPVICGTYPKLIWVPKVMSDDDLRGCAMFRTKNRLPALSYYYKGNGATIWR